MIGRTILHYEIQELLGKGGMGEVYRARDTRLQRDVALKFVAPGAADDEERLARFEREAQTLATLQHSNIASVYGFEDTPDGRFLVMELVEGEDLSQRLERGPVAVDECIEILCAVAEGLNAAHERGIVHRDLKPANVKITPSREVKILDFGLARAFGGDPDSSGASPETSPTITAAMTQAGTILGTAAYMSPEQARGRPADHRSDIWAAGVMAYEMLTGSRLFAGETVTDTLAAVLTREPDLDALPAGTPACLRHVLTRCLARDPKQRWHAAADLRLELLDPVEPLVAAAEPGRRRLRTVLVPLGVLVALVAGWLLGRSGDAGNGAVAYRFSVEDAGFTGRSYSAISPDGKTIASVPLTGAVDDDVIRLRTLDSFAPVLLQGATRPRNPRFSPDSRALAFNTGNGGVYRIDTTGGVPTRLADGAPTLATLDWSRDGFIYIAGVPGSLRASGIFRVNESGGPLESVVEPGEGERALYHPHVAVGTDWLLLSVESREVFSVGAYNLKTKESRRLFEGSTPYFVPPDILVYHRSATADLAAVRIDPDSMEVLGDPVRVLDSVVTADIGRGAYDLAENGTLIYTPGQPGEPMIAARNMLRWSDPAGGTSPVFERKSVWAEPRFSPDGRNLLVREIQTPNCRLWNYDLERGTLTRIVFDEDSHHPVWNPATGRVVYRDDSDEGFFVVERNTDGTGDTRILLESKDTDYFPTSVTHDGRYLLLTTEQHERDLAVLDLQGDGVPETYLSTEFREDFGTVSPDDRWVAYTSDASGRDEVYVQGWPEPGRRHQISIDGGAQPVWGADGRKLYYRSAAGGIEVVDVDTANGFHAGAPRTFLDTEFEFIDDYRNYDIAPDGSRAVTITTPEATGDRSELRVILRWDDEVRKLLHDR